MFGVFRELFRGLAVTPPKPSAAGKGRALLAEKEFATRFSRDNMAMLNGTHTLPGGVALAQSPAPADVSDKKRKREEEADAGARTARTFTATSRDGQAQKDVLEILQQ